MNDATPRPPVESLSAEHVLRAVSLVKTGTIYDLDCGRWHGMPLGIGHAPFQMVMYRTPQGIENQGDQDWWLSPPSMGGNEVHLLYLSELLIGSTHTGTHIDALSHITCGSDNHWFGGATPDRNLGDFGVLAHDASSIPPIVTRGVLVDVAGAKGVAALEAHYEIDRGEIEDVLSRQGSRIESGDIVLVRTGYLSVWPDPGDMEKHRQAGINREAAEYLMDMGAVAVGGDTEGLENQLSKVRGNPLPVHVAMLIERGVHILEMVYLEDLARDEVYEFLFACLPLKIRGATGSMVRPVAIA